MFKKIVVAIDLGQIERGRKIINRANALLDDGGEIVLLNVVEDIPGYLAIDLPSDIVEKNRLSAADTLKELAEKSDKKVRTEVRTGPPARNILESAEENSADLIVVASHRPDFSNYLLGSTADRVVRHAEISVLVDR
jgi:universal stress protein F